MAESSRGSRVDPGIRVCFDVSHRSHVVVQGSDRASFVHNFCTQDIVNLPSGRGCEALFLNIQGKILAYVRIFARHDCLRLDMEPGLGPKLVEHLERYVITEDVVIQDITQEFCHYHLASGEAARDLGKIANRDLSSWTDLQHEELSVADARCEVRRNDMLSLPGFDLLFARNDKPVVDRILSELGFSIGDEELYHRLRIEAGTPAYGVDVDESNLPQELQRDSRLLCFTKGCYLGQETVVRIRDRGHVNRYLCGLRIAAGPDARIPSGTVVKRDGQEIGRVTSSAWSPALGAAIALAYLRRGFHQPGTQVQVMGVPAVVHTLPFVRHA